MELREHAGDGDDQNAFGAATLHELREQNAAFQRLSEADRVGDEDALPRFRERDLGGFELIVEHIHRGFVADGQSFVGGRHLPQLRFEVQESGAKTW
ncbi:MAG: hypothetical protein R3E66_24455 [bacterium]